MKTSDTINEIAKAMSLAQSQMTAAYTDSTNPHFRSKYANLESVIDAFRIPLCSNGLAFWQDVATTETQVMIYTRIIHSSGQWVEFGPLCIPIGKKDAHGIGSATTYGKRYALCAAMGVAPGEVDDDANEAVTSVHGHVPGSKKEKSKTKTEENPEDEAPITHEQVRQLHQVADECDPEYIAKVYGWLKDKGVNGFDGINSSKLFNSVIGGMKKNAQIYKAGKDV